MRIGDNMQGKKLFVGNLDFSVTQEDLNDMFSEFGEVVSTVIIKNKGFGFVEMSNPIDAEKALTELDSTDFKNRTLRIDEAHDRKPKQNRKFKRRFRKNE